MDIYNNVAFIPLRGGSKSIPLKNIKNLSNRPLVYWVLDAANNCEYIDKIFVCTDSDEIKRVVEDYCSSKVIVIGRSEETSTDYATTESVMLEFANQYIFNNIVLIQATSPMLTSDDLTNGFLAYEKDCVDSVLSVVNQKRFVWKKEEEKYLPHNYNPQKRPRRQDFDGFLVENGAFYITSRERLLSTKCRISGNIECVKMKENSYFEIDEPMDWIIVEKLIQNQSEFKFNNIKVFLTDCDGVLTDGGMYYSESGDELKKFNTKDGMAFELLKKHGIITGIITGEDIELVKRRADKLKVDELYLGIKNKKEIIEEICIKYNILPENILYIGDDINDLEVLKIVGFSCCPNDAMECVKNVVNYVTKLDSGKGAVREIVELILREGV